MPSPVACCFTGACSANGVTFQKLHFRSVSLLVFGGGCDMYTGSDTNNVPFLLHKNFYYKTISMYFDSITISRSSTPCDILGEVFRLLSTLCETFTCPADHTRWRSLCRTLYVFNARLLLLSCFCRGCSFTSVSMKSTLRC